MTASPAPGGATLIVRLGSDAPRLIEADADLAWQRQPFGHPVDEGAWQVARAPSPFGPTIELFNRLAQAPVGSGVLGQLVRHRNIALWQFLPAYIWPEVFRVWELVGALTRLVDEQGAAIVHAIVDPTMPSCDLWEAAARSVAEARGCGFRVERLPSGRPSPATLRRHLGTNGELVAWTLRARSVARPPRLAPPEGRRLLFATIARHAQAEPFAPSGVWDEQLSPLLPALAEAGWSVVAVDCPYGSRRDAARATATRATHVADVQWLDFEAYSSLAPALGVRFGAELSRLLDDEAFEQWFRRDGVPLLPALRPTLRRAITVLAPECAALLDMAGRILDASRPDAVMATYETGPYARALLIESARRGIPTLGLQHGMIFDNHYDYLHEDVAPGATGEQGFVVPDVTCVWAPRWRSVLCDVGSYPATAVTVTGNWRHDRLRDRHWDRDRARHELGLAGAGAVVLILPGGEDPTGHVERVLRVCRLLGLRPLVKVHPADDSAPVAALLAAGGWPATALVQRLPEALAAADVVVSVVSTAIAEALLFERPVVLFDSLRHAGGSEYLASGACVHATDDDELRRLVRLLVEDPDARRQLLDRAGEFTRSFFGELDGDCGRRVVSALEALLP